MTATEKTQFGSNEKAATKVTILQVLGSILASFYGVQSSKNRKRDFESGNAKTFIIAGIFLTGVWYFAIYLVVTLVLHLTK
ncbi:MAG: DUF2970 domain-containing protein [Halioglobus sp.]